MVEVVRHIAGIAVARLAGRVNEGVPDAGPPATRPCLAFNLGTRFDLSYTMQALERNSFEAI